MATRTPTSFNRCSVWIVHSMSRIARVLLPAADSFGLRFVLRQVGVMQEVIAGRIGARHRDADGDAGDDRAVRTDLDRYFHCPHDAVRDVVGVAEPTNALEQKRELVTAE